MQFTLLASMDYLKIYLVAIFIKTSGIVVGYVLLMEQEDHNCEDNCAMKTTIVKII